jgi:predicted transcriptional regulator of viral defense system
MAKDYGFDPREADLKFFKPLQAVEITDHIRGRPIKTHHTTRDYTSQIISGSFSRLITVGDLFVQMLDEPDNCGGMHHVIEAWENHAEYYVEDIIESVEKSQTDIVKVRAGYILTERIEVQDARVDGWKRFAQRGGSRRLNPSGPYKPVFSEDWMISIND